ncbi:RidA family protein [Streptomyces orinoci]|uniref:RidA family protein n=1 Tax=Streptomyces orinoci TaxID=67339 RepID=A0ABV3K3Z5_STRON|nr:RidA family protein [Streptomyces orinoci]
MSVERLNPPELAPPRGFSHAVTAVGGRLVFLAGQTALDGAGALVEGGLVEQFRQALSNLLTALRGAGGEAGVLVRVTVYTTDVAEYRARTGELGAVWRELAGREYPAMALIGVSRLWDEGALVELDGIAVVGG